jgi:hypothetical protein
MFWIEANICMANNSNSQPFALYALAILPPMTPPHPQRERERERERERKYKQKKKIVPPL